MNFDITLAFDTAEYLNPQLYLLTNTLKDKLPEDTIVHIVTNREENDDVIQHMKNALPLKIWYNDGTKTSHLESRCRYMFNCFEVETNKPWLIKMESDMLILKHLSEFDNILEEQLDLVMEPENRKIFSDVQEKRLWRRMYKNMGVETPSIQIQYRENKEYGLPLFGTGIICVKSNLIRTINDRWILQGVVILIFTILNEEIYKFRTMNRNFYNNLNIL